MRGKYKKAFTLIELLVVIAIIAILATLVLVSVARAQSKARDSKRIADISSIGTALQMYRDKMGFYPPNNDFDDSGCWGMDINNPGQGWWDSGNDYADPNDTFISGLETEGLIERVPREQTNLIDLEWKNFTSIESHCTYRYWRQNNADLSSIIPEGCCFGSGKKFAVLYTALELVRSVKTEDQRPVCLRSTSCWYEGSADTRGYALYLPMN